MWLLLLFVTYYVSLIITLIFCTYFANMYFLVNLFLQHFIVVESSVTQCCLWQTFPLIQDGPVLSAHGSTPTDTVIRGPWKYCFTFGDCFFCFVFGLVWFFCVVGAVQCNLLLWQQTIPQAEPVVTPVVCVTQHFLLCHNVLIVYK